MKKKTLASRISTSGIDKYYQLAMDSGALGGKVAGAGGGGFLLIYCPVHKQEVLLQRMHGAGLSNLSFKIGVHGSKVVFFSNGV